MGRHFTGAEMVEDSLPICLTFLKQRGIVKKGCVRADELTWSSKGRPIATIGILCDYSNSSDIYIRLVYNITSRQATARYDYKIGIVEAPTNLGRGKQLYFICPTTGNRCRKIYRAYGNHKWQSREAYKQRLYYRLQQIPKLDRFRVRHQNVYAELEQNAKKRQAFEYAGKETKRSIRISNKTMKLHQLNYLKSLKKNWPVSLQKFMDRYANSN